jgi:hypothetical protein
VEEHHGQLTVLDAINLLGDAQSGEFARDVLQRGA